MLIRRAKTIRMAVPDGELRSISSRTRLSGVSVSKIGEEDLRVILHPTGTKWLGVWNFEADSSSDAAVPVFEAFASSSLEIRLSTDDSISTGDQFDTNETGRSHNRFVNVSASSSMLTRARVSAISVKEQSRNRVEMAPTHDRLTIAGQDVREIDRSMPGTEQLTGTLPVIHNGQVIVNYEMEVQGTTLEGHPFTRAKQDSVVRVLPRSEFRRQRAKKYNNLQLIRGYVSELQFDRAGRVIGLVIDTQEYRQAFHVDDLMLQQLLSEIELDQGEFIFGIDGDVIRSVVDLVGASQ